MKNLITILLSILLLFPAVTNAQNNEKKADDSDRISLTPQVSDQQIPQGAKNLLMNKMKQICAKNGLSGDGENPFFVIDASVDVLSKEITPTAPPMHALNLQVNFFIKDVVNNNVYSETSFEIKGVGKNETKAYIAGLKNINTSKGQFKALVDRGKTKILEFYNSECDFILSKAKALQKQGSNAEAIKVLKSVPKVSLECYDKCMEILGEIEPPVEETAASGSVGEGGQSGASPMATVVGKEIEIAEGIFIVYQNGKQLGDRTQLFFQLQNRGGEDFELNDYNGDTRCVDGNGAEFNPKLVEVAGKEGSYAKATIMPGTPVVMKCEFDKMNTVAMFEYKYKGRVFRIKDLPIGEAASAAPATEEAVGGSPVTHIELKLGSKIFVEEDGETRMQYKQYTPAKIKTLASAATKNEYEVLAMGDCSTDIIWTGDAITKWHKATKENLKEGMLVIYTAYGGEITDTKCFWIGRVIAVDELYKNKVTIKGHYNEIHKPVYTEVLIVDSATKTE